MPRKRSKPVAKLSGRRLVVPKKKPTRHWQSTLVLVASALTLLGLVSWAVSSDATEWNHWLGGLRAKPPASGPDGEGPDGEAEDGNGPAQFQGDGRATLGEFSIDRRQSDGSMLTVSFKLSGNTSCKDKEAFQEFVKDDYAAFRKYAEGAIRDCQFSALSDEKSLARKVVVRVNRSLGRHFLQNVEFDELTIHETIDHYGTTEWKPGSESQ
jgi:hypothetical protein